MTTWVALLRAVNVAGKNVIPMAELRALMADLGHADAATHLQSGNVLFASDDDGADLGARISSGIAERFDHDVAVLMRSRDELARLIATTPWAEPADSSSGVVFLSGSIASGLDTDRFAPDRAHVDGPNVHVDCPGGFGTTKLTVAWLERQTGLVGTRRNWKTVQALHDKLEAFE